MNEGFEVNAKKGSFNQWDSPSIPSLCEKMSTAIESLRKALMLEGKHNTSVLVHKTVILPLLDEMDRIASNMPNVPYSCSECSLWKRDKDKKIATETIGRLCQYATTHKDAVLTPDEAENLATFIR